MKINVIGIGTAVDEITIKGLKKLRDLPVFVRSSRLKGVATLDNENIKYTSLDEFYDECEDFDELNYSFSQFLAKKVQELGEICYLVDGSGTFDSAVSMIDNVEIEYFPTMSKGSNYHGKLGSGKSLTEISAYDFVNIENIGGVMADNVYIFDIDNMEIASQVKLGLSKIVGDEDSIFFCMDGVAKAIPMYQLDWEKCFNENCGVFITANKLIDKTVFTFTDVLDLLDRLREPDGCPWDIAQTHKSLRMCAIEEAYEVAEAIDLEDDIKLQEEIGDLLLQSVFHAKVAKDTGEFTVVDVMTELCRKLIDRHTHIFGEDVDKVDKGTDTVDKYWEINKNKIKGYHNLREELDGISIAMPSIMYAQKVAKKAAKYNFDFSSIDGVYGKIEEELNELKEAVRDNSNIAEEVGDLFFAVANVARFLGVNGEEMLSMTSKKFIERVKMLEITCEKRGLDMKTMTEQELDEVYVEMKNLLKKKA